MNLSSRFSQMMLLFTLIIIPLFEIIAPNRASAQALDQATVESATRDPWTGTVTIVVSVEEEWYYALDLRLSFWDAMDVEHKDGVDYCDREPIWWDVVKHRWLIQITVHYNEAPYPVTGLTLTVALGTTYPPTWVITDVLNMQWYF